MCNCGQQEGVALIDLHRRSSVRYTASEDSKNDLSAMKSVSMEGSTISETSLQSPQSILNMPAVSSPLCSQYSMIPASLPLLPQGCSHGGVHHFSYSGVFNGDPAPAAFTMSAGFTGQPLMAPGSCSMPPDLERQSSTPNQVIASSPSDCTSHQSTPSTRKYLQVRMLILLYTITY